MPCSPTRESQSCGDIQLTITDPCLHCSMIPLHVPKLSFQNKYSIHKNVLNFSPTRLPALSKDKYNESLL